MKNNLILLLFISFIAISSCDHEDSIAEPQMEAESVVPTATMEDVSYDIQSRSLNVNCAAITDEDPNTTRLWRTPLFSTIVPSPHFDQTGSGLVKTVYSYTSDFPRPIPDYFSYKIWNRDDNFVYAHRCPQEGENIALPIWSPGDINYWRWNEEDRAWVEAGKISYYSDNL
ncbi:MAG: hypothetical protein AAF984_11595 [Verrucomicrobiota bacterium]